MVVLLFETFFRSRHPFIARSEKLTGILLPRIQRLLFLGEVEVGSFHHINRLIEGTRRILDLLILCRGLLFHGGLAVAVALYNRRCAPRASLGAHVSSPAQRRQIAPNRKPSPTASARVV